MAHPDNVAPGVAREVSQLKLVATFAVAGLLAGVATAGVIKFTATSFMLPDHLAVVDNYSPPELQQERAEVEVRLTHSRGLCMGGTYGLIIAVACCLAMLMSGVVSAGNNRWIGYVLAMVLGIAGGSVGGRLAVFLSEHWQGQIDIIREGMLRGVLFVSTALLIGIALGSGIRSRVTAAVFAALGAVAASMLAPIMTSLLFPSSHSEHFLMDDAIANAAVFSLGSTLSAIALAIGVHNSLAASLTSQSATDQQASA